MKTRCLLFLSLLFFINLSYGQNTLDRKTRLKRMKKINENYDYRLFENKCNKVLVGNKIMGGNDGGGRMQRGVENVSIISLIDKKLTLWPSPYSKSYTKFSDARNDKGVVRVVDTNKKIGLLSICDKVVLEPKYDEIGKFNKDGLAIASVGNKIDVIDLKGNSVLENPFEYVFDKSKHESSFKGGGLPFPMVINNTILISKDNRNFGLFDILNNKVIAPLNYDYINPTPFINNRFSNKEELIGYEARKDQKVTIVDTNG